MTKNSHFLIRLPMGGWFTWLAIGLGQALIIMWLTYGTERRAAMLQYLDVPRDRNETNKLSMP